jgi:hypothetical protein
MGHYADVDAFDPAAAVAASAAHLGTLALPPGTEADFVHVTHMAAADVRAADAFLLFVRLRGEARLLAYRLALALPASRLSFDDMPALQGGVTADLLCDAVVGDGRPLRAIAGVAFPKCGPPRTASLVARVHVLSVLQAVGGARRCGGCGRLCARLVRRPRIDRCAPVGPAGRSHRGSSGPGPRARHRAALLHVKPGCCLTLGRGTGGARAAGMAPCAGL